MNVSEALAACAENPGIRALVAFKRLNRCTQALDGLWQLIPRRDWTFDHGWTFRFPHGSVIHLRHLDGDVVRRTSGMQYQLVITDGLSGYYRDYLASRLRADDPGPPILGIHTLTEEVEASWVG